MTQMSKRFVAGVVALACVVVTLGLPIATPVTAALVHQFTFNDGTANDSIGGQDGTVVDPGSPTAVFGAGLLDLSANIGEPSNGITEDAYVDLPNFMVSSAAASGTAGAVSFELWVTVETNRVWAEIFSFGTSDGGEDTSDGGGSSDYLPLIPQNGGTGTLRLSNHSGSGVAPVEPVVDDAGILSPGVEHHLVGVYDETDPTASLDGTMTLYRDGNLIGTAALHPSFDLTTFNDNNNWLGRSQWPDALFDGNYNEVRIYDHPLTAQEVADSFATGPVKFQGPTLTVDRETGALTLNNPSAAVPMVGYSLTSQVGALDASAWTPIAGNYDASATGDGSFDPNDTWTVTSSAHEDLAEHSDGTTGGALDATPVILSTADGWIESPVEDLQMVIELADGSTQPALVEFTGNGDVPFERSDLNFDGVVDRDDWPTFRAGILTDLSGLSPAEAYGRGDLDGDGNSDVHDFRIFKADFDAAQGPGAFDAMVAGVPEPSTLLLLAIAAVFVLGARVRYRNSLVRCLLAAVVMSAFGGSSTPVSAALVHQYTFNDGTANDSVGTANGTLVDPGGLAVYSPTGRLDVSANDGEGSNQDWATATSGIYVDLPNGIISAATSGGTRGQVTFETWLSVETNRAWAEILSFGTSDGGEDSSGGGPSSDYLTLIPQNGATGTLRLENHSGLNINPPGFPTVIDDTAPLAPGTQHYLVSVFDRTEEVDDMNGTMRLYADGQLIGTTGIHPDLDINQLPDNNNWLGRSQWPDPLFDGAYNEFRVYDNALSAEDVAANFAEGPDDVELLGLEVDTVTGKVTLENLAASAVEFDYYQIDSAGGALNANGWDSLSDQDFQTVGPEEGQSWDEADASNDSQLAELYLDGSSVLAAGESVRLGNAFDPSVFGSSNDGDLTFQFSLTSGEIVNGVVEYVIESFVLGDVNLDGIVNGLDVDPFVDVLLNGPFQAEADMNEDGVVNGLDVDPFVVAVVGGGVAAVPEPTTLALAISLALAGLTVFTARGRR